MFGPAAGAAHGSRRIYLTVPNFWPNVEDFLLGSSQLATALIMIAILGLIVCGQAYVVGPTLGGL